MTDERDAMMDRLVESLRPLPVVDDAAKARLLIAVAAERERDRERALRVHGVRRMGRWIAGGAGILAAATLAGTVLLRIPAARSTAGQPSGGPTSSTAAVRLAGSDAAGDAASAAQAVELVLRAPAAATVGVVGDFNGWDQSQAPMKRDQVSGLWSVTLSVRPGRHVYAFIVDDTVWMPDPRAPSAKDADFGRPGSVLLVGRP